MTGSPDRRLSDEQTRPAHADRAASASGASPTSLKGCLGWLSNLIALFKGPIQEEDVKAFTEEEYVPPPGTCGYATPFTPAPQVLLRSRRALKGYHDQYQEPDPDQQPYPWRMVVARHTCLPASLRGFLDEQDQLDTPDDDIVVHAASEWLFQDQRAQALFGIASSDARQRFRHSDTNLMRVRPESDNDIPVTQAIKQGDINPARASYSKKNKHYAKILAHVRYQQVHQDWPVFGGQVVVHLATNDRRTSVTSSYFPLEDTTDFSRGIEKAMALDAARQALADHLDDLSDPHDLSEWDVDVVPYTGSELCVFPFAGNYHLAYQVELLSPDYSQAWRVTVDAESGDILGPPENLTFHVQYFATAGDVLKEPPSLESKPLVENPCKDFMKVGIYSGTDPEQDPEPNWSHSDTNGPNFEATNVAIHAEKIYDHFVNKCGAYPSKLQSYEHNGQQVKPGLRARVAKPGTHLDMGFINAKSLHPKLIVFQTDENGGIIVTDDGKLAHHPAYDPEVIYHEVTHGLMWLLNPKPFDDLIDSVPFGRALVEGYANYFARSLAAGADSGSSLWAREAYRETDAGGKGWDDRWALSREKWEDGEDLLPAPNLYPPNKTTRLDEYDVGMIWARALWDLRPILGADQVDLAALDAYNYLHGWTANFEMAAEGIIDAAEKAGILDDEVPRLFALRGILAAQSIQALVREGTTVLAGADAGLMRSTYGGQNWEDWDDLAGGEKLTDVVALTVEGATFYAATETGVYQRDGDEWSPVGQWPADQTPYALVAVNGSLYAGTGRGVWHYEDNNGWTSAGTFLALDMTSASLPSRNVLYAASFDCVYYRSTSSSPWRRFVDSSALGDIVAVAAQDNFAYLGTLAHGIWRLQIVSSELTQIASWADLGNGAVLTLALHGNKVVAGTTAGLYVGTPGADNTWTWELCEGLPDKAKVTVVLPINSDILASTATHGLWRWNGNQWEEVQGVEKLTGKD